MFWLHLFSRIFLNGKKDKNFAVNLILFYFSPWILTPVLHSVMHSHDTVCFQVHFSWPINSFGSFQITVYESLHTLSNTDFSVCAFSLGDKRICDIKTYKRLKRHRSTLFRVSRSAPTPVLRYFRKWDSWFLCCLGCSVKFVHNVLSRAQVIE